MTFIKYIKDLDQKISISYLKSGHHVSCKTSLENNVQKARTQRILNVALPVMELACLLVKKYITVEVRETLVQMTSSGGVVMEFY